MTIYGLTQVQLVLIPALSVGLVIFGVLFNRAYARADSDETTEGWTWAWVVLGCSINLIALGVVFGIEVALVAFLFFACSGISMAVGEKRRLDARARASRRAIRGAVDES